MAAQAFEGWIRGENVEPFLRLFGEAVHARVDLAAALDSLLDTDPARGRWWSPPEVAPTADPAPPSRSPVLLRMGREPGTGIVEIQLTPRDWGADAVVDRVRVLCSVMQSWSLVRAI